MKNYTMKDVQTAVNLAFDLFGDTKRKADKTPYIGHILRVLGIVQEGCGGFRAQVGAVLHDVLEDIDNGEAIILEHFGQDMVDLVRECSDTETRPKPTWMVRKQKHIEHMKSASEDALRILLGDKIDNGRNLCVLANYASDCLNTFNASPHEQAWYFHNVARAICRATEDIKGLNYQAEELLHIAEEIAWFTEWTEDIEPLPKSSGEHHV